MRKHDRMNHKTATLGGPWAELNLVHSCLLLDDGGWSSLSSTPKTKKEQRGVVAELWGIANSNCAKQTGLQKCGKNSDFREIFTAKRSCSPLIFFPLALPFLLLCVLIYRFLHPNTFDVKSAHAEGAGAFFCLHALSRNNCNSYQI